jgi:hypothetical protein
VACFEASRHDEAVPETAPLVRYLRGVGLSIVPEVFDTHGAAEKELATVAEAARSADATGENRNAWSAIIRETKLKAWYFLVSMRMRDDRHESVAEILDALSDEGGAGFYGRWARKQIRATERRSRHSASAPNVKETTSGLQDRH